MGYAGAGGKLIHEKNQKQKISWHCPFNMCLCSWRPYMQFLIFFFFYQNINLKADWILTFSAEFTPLGEDHAAEYFFASDARFDS